MREMVGDVLAAWARLAASTPLGAGATPSSVAERRGAAIDCDTEQMPQMRGAITSASSAGRPTSNCSKPR